jgi:SpoVK/Ycf46/Vps4 family AAA+-type ATPase
LDTPGAPCAFYAPDALSQVLLTISEAGQHALEGIARAVPVASPDEAFALGPDTREEFEALVQRCRHRDRLAAALPATIDGASGNCGVRALFKGPSGTGKTLAARQLAAALHRPLYRVDLAATVSKYIGETERNLERVFEAAEALDIVLLLDEGDALLAGRTGVSNATDRYANLETNYLLQRLEHYSGVLVVTTNAAERIDTAFARRMDVSIDFPLPDAVTRLALWHAHLGPRHTVPDEMLQAVALRCTLAGGQVRNAALHAMLLAIDQGRTLGPEHLRPALAREYRKVGQRCPSIEVADEDGA